MFSAKHGVQLLCQYIQYANITQIIISPGSRHAPIIQTLVAMDFAELHVIPDERSAAFFALGLSEGTNHPAAIITTSGTASLNLAPAIAESYYRYIPLLAITADRPSKWINNGEGQCMDQVNVFSNYIYAQYNYPVDEDYSQSIAYETLNQAFSDIQDNLGPVHINIPIDEPLYDFVPTIQQNSLHIAKNTRELAPPTELDQLSMICREVDSIMIVVGQMPPDHNLIKAIDSFSRLPQVTVIAEHLSNLQEIEHISLFDIIYTSRADLPNYAPELVIQLGDAILSKKLKKFLRSNTPQKVIYLHNRHHTPNVFDAKVSTLEGDIYEHLKVLMPSPKSASDYRRRWLTFQMDAKKRLDLISISASWCDLVLFRDLMERLPSPAVLHLGNSSAVRYAQLFYGPMGISYFGNRGVSGIDGCISTALGYAYVSDLPNYLIIGDISFFYDSNAFWKKPLAQRLKIILINNQGGNIFSMIEGPDRSDIMHEYQMTPHHYAAKYICAHYQIEYFECHDLQEFDKAWPMFTDNENISVLEVFTDPTENSLWYRKLFQS